MTLVVYKNTQSWPGVVVHTYNSSMQETEAGRF
jgi:hypothetical protein